MNANVTMDINVNRNSNDGRHRCLSVSRPAATCLILAAASLVVCATASCLPGSGEAETVGGGLGKHDGGGLADSMLVWPDLGPAVSDNGLPYPEATVAGDDSGVPFDAHQPSFGDAASAGPQPPFGTSVGMTAYNFVSIPDCDGNPHTLYPLFNTHKGFLVAMMSPS